MTPVNLAVCTSPQHVMNLAQAHLAGLVSGPVTCLVLEHIEVGNTYAGKVLRGTIAAVSQLCSEISIRHVALRFPFSNIRIAHLVRRTKVSAGGTVALGVYPSPLWARSAAFESAHQLVLLDDGASSLTLDLGRIISGRMAGTTPHLPAKVLEGIAGTVRQLRAIPMVYSCFPIDVIGGQVVRHRYVELRRALRGEYLLGAEAPGHAVWIDSNYSWLSTNEHLELVKTAVQQFGIDAYVPHRRTEQDFVSRIGRELGLTTLRPDLPLELVIGSWTKAGALLFTPPTSLVYTAGLFLESPGEIAIVKTSHWLRNRAEIASANEADGFALAINHATLIEQSMQATNAFRVFHLG